MKRINRSGRNGYSVLSRVVRSDPAALYPSSIIYLEKATVGGFTLPPREKANRLLPPALKLSEGNGQSKFPKFSLRGQWHPASRDSLPLFSGVGLNG